ncbi:MAG: response regulator [Hyphomonadaceae bacterium]|nr:response regulator [Hyphomonadaceae bacterium]
MTKPKPLINLRQTKMLVVEDNPQALEILSQVLVGFGVSEFRKCETLEDAYLAIDKSMFDVMIVDGELSGESGFAFTRHVRGRIGANNFATPIVIVTGAPTRAKVAEARDGGANFVIAKPIVPRTLLDRIVWIARHSRDFIESDAYCGPDRRFHNIPLPFGVEDRRAEAVRLTATPERDLSQDEIDALF